MNDEVRNPFPGLRPFEFEDNHLFFGRDEQTTELTTRLRKNRFVAVVGTSGSGKSSLVRAGLLPELLSGTMAGAGSSWETSIMRPGGDPLTNLANSIIEADLYDPDEEDIVSQVRATLTRSGLGLVEAMRQSDLPEGTNFLLVVDQFEEIFRFRRSDDATDEQAAFFVNLLLEASAQTDLPLYIIITMRSDFLGECSQFPRLADTVNEGEFLIPRLNRDQRKEAILGPVKVAGGGITDRLLLRLLNDIGDDPDQLPILQHALMRTWDLFEDQGIEGDLDLEHYNATGGMAEALSRHADEVYNEQPDAEHKRIAEKLFKSLTEKVDANRGIRRPMALKELHEICGGEEDHLRAVIDSFRRTGCTFLMPAGERAINLKSIIDISHESLMRVWRSLRNWVDEEAQSAKIYRRLADTATLFKDDKAGLYRDPDLQIALSWREENRPNKTWADRYYPGFEGAMAFLDDSHEEAAREEREREEARQREVAQAKALAEEQQRRAIAQAKVANIFKIAGACLLVLLCVSLYLTKVAIDSKAEVNDKIFQLAARSTSTAEKLAAEGALFESMAWFNDAAKYSEENPEARSYVAGKLKEFLSKVPILTESELLPQAIVNYRHSNDGITVIRQGGNFGQPGNYTLVEEFIKGETTLSSTEIEPFRANWISISSDGEAICYANENDDVFVDFKETGNKKSISDISGFPVAGDFKKSDNKKIVLVGKSDTTLLNIYNFHSGGEKIQISTGLKYNYVRVFYLENGKILVVGNIRESGSNYYALTLVEVNETNATIVYTKKEEGLITSFDLTKDGQYVAIALEYIKGKQSSYAIKIHKVDTGILFDSYDELPSPVKKMVTDNSGINLAALNQDDDVTLFNIYSRKSAKINSILGDITSLSFSPLDSFIITISEDRGINFFDTVSLKKALPEINLSSRIHHAFFDVEENLLFVSATSQDSAYLCYEFITAQESFIASEMSTEWPFPNRRAMGRLAKHWHGPKEFAFDGDESTIVHNAMDDKNPYWIGELERTCNIKTIRIVNRPNSQWKRQMVNYQVTILDENKNPIWEKKYLNSDDENYTPPDHLICNIDEDISGKYIKIQCYKDGFQNGPSRRTISFAEIYVLPKGGLQSANNEELFTLTKVINPLKLNEKGEIEPQSITDINNNLFQLKEDSFYSELTNLQRDEKNLLLSKLDSHYKQENWPAFLCTYDYVSGTYPDLATSNTEIIYANALLETRQYEKTYTIFKSNLETLGPTEKASFIMLDSLQGNNLPAGLNVNELLDDYPEITLFVKEKSDSLSKSLTSINSKLPSYYKPNVTFDNRFYDSFLLEFEISNDSSGCIFHMGGNKYTDGISLFKTGNNLELFITNESASEAKKLSAWLGQSGVGNTPWLKHQIFWDSESKTVNYFVNNNHFSQLRFDSSLGRNHPNLILGADLNSQNFGNMKLKSFKIYDKKYSVDDVLNNNTEMPIYEVTHDNYQDTGDSYNVEVGKKSASIDAYGSQVEEATSFIQIKNDHSNEQLIENYIFKSAMGYFAEDYEEAVKALASSIVLTGERINPIQKQLGTMILSKKHDANLSKYISQQPQVKMTNWKLELLQRKLKTMNK